MGGGVDPPISPESLFTHLKKNADRINSGNFFSISLAPDNKPSPHHPEQAER